MRTRYFQRSVIPAFVALLTLAGCGGGGGNEPQTGSGSTARTGAAPAPPASGTPDAFVTQVESVIAASSDTAEPREIGGFEATAPDTTEPMPLS